MVTRITLKSWESWRAVQSRTSIFHGGCRINSFHKQSVLAICLKESDLMGAEVFR